MAYYVTLYSGGTLDTNFPATTEFFGIYEKHNRYGVEFIKVKASALFFYEDGIWKWKNQTETLQNSKEYWAINREELYNAIEKSYVYGDYDVDEDGVKVKYLNDGIILLKGIYTGFPFHLEGESQAEPLSTPTGLYADNITSDSATTHWTGDANASNYKVQYKAAGDTVWTETYTD